MRQSESTIVIAADAIAMRAIGAAFADALLAVSAAPIVIAIEGELGAGKTTFVGGVLNALGLEGPARSPTYTLIEPYEFANRSIFHLDLYRLAAPFEVEALGLRDLLDADAVLLVEWPEKGEGFIPAADLHLLITYATAPAEGRSLTFVASSEAGKRLQSCLELAVAP